MQQNEVKDFVWISVPERLCNLSPSSSEHCIFMVHDPLRKINEKAYEPYIVAIGPYHRSKKNLRMMEEHKLRYLHLFLEREKENLEKYKDALRQVEREIRSYYKEPLNHINENDFIEMMVLDGVFIIELVRKFDEKGLREENDQIFELAWIFYYLRRDLMLFENQIPFIVLCKLFDMIKASNSNKNIINLASEFFSEATPIFKFVGKDPQHDKIKHLLGLVHHKLLPPFEEGTEDWEFIHCTTELRESGIKFEVNKMATESENKSEVNKMATESENKYEVNKMATESENMSEVNSLFTIKFSDGVFQILQLIIDDETESFFRNLIAYEQYLTDECFHVVTYYSNFMDCLVNSGRDVKILRRSKIISNWQGDDESVSTMFNKINDWVVGPAVNNFCYATVFHNVNNHCDKRRNKWMAKLRRDYFSSPWTVISVIAAFVLFVLTLLQTVFTVKS